MGFYWNEEKNAYLKHERNLSFERIVVAIEEGHLLDILEHPNTEKYQHQMLLVVDIDDYAVCVPCIIKKTGDYFLKTAFQSRKYTKLYKLGGYKNE